MYPRLPSHTPLQPISNTYTYTLPLPLVPIVNPLPPPLPLSSPFPPTQTEPSLKELLTWLPRNQGGVYPIAAGLLNPSPAVRQAALHILFRIEHFESTRFALRGLNYFLSATYERLKFQQPPPQVEYAADGSDFTAGEDSHSGNTSKPSTSCILKNI